MPLALGELLLQPHAPAQPVARRGETVLSRGDLLGGVRATICALDGRPGGRWALFEPDAFRFAIGLFALLHSGRTPLLPGNAQAGTLRELDTRVDGFLGAFDGVAAQPVHERGGAAALAPVAADAAIELMTSGSSGGAKTIVKHLVQLDRELACQERRWGGQLGADCAVLASVSHQHIYGLLFRLLLPLASGRRFHALAYDYNETLFAAVAREPRALVVSSPAHLTRLPPGIDWAPVRPRLALLLSSGGPLPAAAAQQLRELAGQAPCEILGSTETGGVAWRQQGDDSWEALPGVEVALNGEGLLRAASPWADGGVQVMGDRAELLGAGRFRLLGRADEIVKLEEKRLSLTEMNTRLQGHALVAEARVVPLSRARLGAVVVLSASGGERLARDGKRVLMEALRAHLLQFFERVLLPRKWRFVTALPQNSQGKVTRAALQALFEAAPAPLPGEVLAEAESECRIGIDLDRCAEVFAGHFPGLPVLAGVYQLDWAIRHIRRRWYRRVPFQGVEQLKFREAVPPGLRLELTLNDRGDGRVDFGYRCGDWVLSSGRIRFGAGDER